MPEGPELELMRLGLQPLVGQVVNVAPLAERRKYLTRAEIMTNLRGVTLHSIQRVGKRLAFQFDTCLVTFGAGMSGQWRCGREPRKHDILAISSAAGRFFYNDVRRFGFMQLHPPDYVWWSDLGLDGLTRSAMLGPSATAAIRQAFARVPRREMKVALLDQGRIAGIGNIYASEILHRLRVNPWTTVADFPHWGQLGRMTYRILCTAVAGKGATIAGANPYRTVAGEPTNGLRLRVYGRTGWPCLTCKTGVIEQAEQAGRTTYWCSTCQPAAL